jgi:hypothetical protein
MHRTILLAVLASLVFLGQAHARLIEPWPYKKLLKEADVVVVATALSSKETGEAAKLRGWQIDFVGVDTTFAVKAVLKGEVKGDQLAVFHYRLRPGVAVENGPLLISFRTKPLAIKTKRAKVCLGVPSYLLFLKRRQDGRYEAVSGQVDPELSVREMHPPLAEGLGEQEEK